MDPCLIEVAIILKEVSKQMLVRLVVTKANNTKILLLNYFVIDKYQT